MEAKYGYHAHEPSNCQNDDEGYFRAFGNLQVPDDLYRKEGHKKIGEDVYGGIDEPDTVWPLSANDTDNGALYSLHWAFHARRLFGFTLFGGNGFTCIYRYDNRSNSPCDTHCHDNVKWYAHLAYGKDSAVLKQDRHLCKGKADIIKDDAPKQVLLVVSKQMCVKTVLRSYLEDRPEPLRKLDEDCMLAIACVGLYDELVKLFSVHFAWWLTKNLENARNSGCRLSNVSGVFKCASVDEAHQGHHYCIILKKKKSVKINP